jgi:hypothetical protein
MTVELGGRGVQNIEYLKQKLQLSSSEVVEQALALLRQKAADWDVIQTDNGLNEDLSEAEADQLALEAQRAVRNHRKQ